MKVDDKMVLNFHKVFIVMKMSICSDSSYEFHLYTIALVLTEGQMNVADLHIV